MLGTNDLAVGYEPDEIMENLRVLHELCHRRGVVTVAMGIPSNATCWERSGQNAQIDDYCKRWTQTNRLLSEYAASKVPSNKHHADNPYRRMRN